MLLLRDLGRQAKSEADHVLRLIRGYKLSYPVYYDLKEPGTEAGRADRNNCYRNFPAETMGSSTGGKKTVDEIAHEVIAGK